ncbi:helix-turn-helix domain-containing protein [Tenacibaculum sp. Mcav3-52]|uniref:helix-turn-helix domain-containing protein n=1 Tax=Tenacibaculum sp. Mcav3-52 TaxID=2917762 RepID=UPI001EF1C709|nr:helix-turn-helix transcriptional regulator [Tenacibaculum sp. Mcav3-52]MCG7501144.1 helix-turn-helix domain-containing protein [Tenacibaculum sp. Mcav3-52]
MIELSEKRLEVLKSEIPIKIGNRVKEIRKQKGLTQTQLAELVGKDRQYLYKIEKAIVTPNVVTISALAIAMEVELQEFFKIKL